VCREVGRIGSEGDKEASAVKRGIPKVFYVWFKVWLCELVVWLKWLSAYLPSVKP
jgi:hypothetical protein